MKNSITHQGLQAMYNRVKSRLGDMRFEEIDKASVALKRKYTQADVQNVANTIARHYGLEKPVYVEYIDLVDTTPARIFINRHSDHIHIQIDSDGLQRPRFTPKNILCILAHELAHEFIVKHGLEYEGLKNEFFTDFMAVYLGCGRLMSDGYINVTVNSYGNVQVTRTETIGYLTLRQMLQVRKMVYGKPKFWQPDYYTLHPRRWLSVVASILLLLYVMEVGFMVWDKFFDIASGEMQLAILGVGLLFIFVCLVWWLRADKRKNGCGVAIIAPIVMMALGTAWLYITVMPVDKIVKHYSYHIIYVNNTESRFNFKDCHYKHKTEIPDDINADTLRRGVTYYYNVLDKDLVYFHVAYTRGDRGNSLYDLTKGSESTFKTITPGEMFPVPDLDFAFDVPEELYIKRRLFKFRHATEIRSVLVVKKELK